MSRHRETGFVRLVGCQGEGIEAKQHSDDITFSNIDICPIMLVGWLTDFIAFSLASVELV
jgi:hypothetical protein